MFTGKQLAYYCLEIYRNKGHWCYWYGTYGNMCTMKKYESKKRQYPSHYTEKRKSGYMKDIELKRRCADCVGMIKSFFWTNGIYDSDPHYATNHCPDKSANGLFKMCKKTGDIKSIPDIPGLVVWKDGHIGVYVGGGYTVEMRGFDYDCIKNEVKKGSWKKWGMLPPSMITYEEPEPEPEPDIVVVTGNSVNVRTAPNTETGKILGVVHRGDIFQYQGITSDNEWYLVIYENQNGWISGKYSTLTSENCDNCTI